MQGFFFIGISSINKWGLHISGSSSVSGIFFSDSCLSSTYLLRVTQTLTRWRCDLHTFPWGSLWVHTWWKREETNSTDAFCFVFLKIFILKNEAGWGGGSGGSGVRGSCQSWRGLLSPPPTSAGENSCSRVSTLYSDPTGLKLCHRKIKSCNDFQYTDMDNNCIG